MTWNRVQFKTTAREQADAENAPRWSDFLVNNWMRLAFNEGWRRILNADPAYRYTKLTVSPDADGFVALATVDTAITPSQRYRFLSERTVRQHRLATVTEVVFNPHVLGSNVRFGDAVLTSGNISAWVNHLPQNPEDFAGVTPDETAVTWPDGHELVLATHLAALLLTKGALESRAAADLFAVVDALYTEMIQSVMSRTTESPQIYAADSSDSWSGGGHW
jgi:hypothetical protein